MNETSTFLLVFVCLLFGVGRVAHSRFLKSFFAEKQLPSEAKMTREPGVQTRDLPETRLSNEVTSKKKITRQSSRQKFMVNVSWRKGETVVVPDNTHSFTTPSFFVPPAQCMMVYHLCPGHWPLHIPHYCLWTFGDRASCVAAPCPLDLYSCRDRQCPLFGHLLVAMSQTEVPITLPFACRGPAAILCILLCVKVSDVARGEISLWRWSAYGGSIRAALLVNQTSING